MSYVRQIYRREHRYDGLGQASTDRLVEVHCVTCGMGFLVHSACTGSAVRDLCGACRQVANREHERPVRRPGGGL